MMIRREVGSSKLAQYDWKNSHCSLQNPPISCLKAHRLTHHRAAKRGWIVQGSQRRCYMNRSWRVLQLEWTVKLSWFNQVIICLKNILLISCKNVGKPILERKIQSLTLNVCYACVNSEQELQRYNLLHVNSLLDSLCFLMNSFPMVTTLVVTNM